MKKLFLFLLFIAVQHDFAWGMFRHLHINRSDYEEILDSEQYFKNIINDLPSDCWNAIIGFCEDINVIVLSQVNKELNGLVESHFQEIFLSIVFL